MNYAMVDKQGRVVNVIVANEDDKSPDPNYVLIQTTTAGPGHTYDAKANVFIAPKQMRQVSAPTEG